MTKPELVRWPRAIGSRTLSEARSARAVVFVHGIFSNHRTFASFHGLFANDPRFLDFELYYYDYDFHMPLEDNGVSFADTLVDHFKPDDFVVIVAHSMGGLVSRLAILSQPLKFIRCLFLLGTPNLGAIRTAQLALLAQLVLESVRETCVVFVRKRGITDLTVADRILERHRNKANYADEIDYVTIPGLYFHSARSIWASGLDKSAKLFSALQVILGIWAAFSPLFAVKLSKPHDGVVEMVSNKLIPCSAGRESEKRDSINHQDTTPVTYAHVEVESCRKLTHVELQSDRDVFEAIAEIILVASREFVAPTDSGSPLQTWRRELAGVSKARIRSVEFGP